MADMKIFVFFFIFMVLSVITLAQESTEPSGSEPGNPQNAPISQPPFSSGIFDHFPLRPPNFDLHALWPHFAAAGFTPRHKRAIEDNSEVEEHPRAKRRVIICNFLLTQGGFRCASCNTVRRCYPFNLGTITTCGGIFPYCNNGVCSRIKGSLCSSTTTTSTSTSTTISTSTSTSTPTSISISTPTSITTSTSAPTSITTSISTPTSTSTSAPTSIITSTSTSTSAPTSITTSTSTSASTTIPASSTVADNSTGSG